MRHAGTKPRVPRRCRRAETGGPAMLDEASVYSKLTTVFRNVFDEDDLVLTPATTADDVGAWDSLSHIRLVLAVSKTFGVKFSASEIGGLKNVGEFVDVIRTK